MEYQHTPVMLKEVLEYLQPKKNGFYIDGTLGGGGYTEAIAKIAGADGKVLAIDLDEQAIANTAKKNLDNVVLVNDNFASLGAVIAENFAEGILFDGFVLDLGLSSFSWPISEGDFLSAKIRRWIWLSIPTAAIPAPATSSIIITKPIWRD